MKAILLILTIAFSFSVLSGQTVDKLDAKFGFKDFKFGQSLSSLDDRIEQYYFSDNLYSWKPESPSELFGWTWEDLQLGFHKDKLVYIGIDFSENEYMFVSLKKSLESLFGPSIAVGYQSLQESGVKKSYQWIGEKVIMDISHNIVDGEYVTDENAISITIRLKNIDRIIEMGEF